MDDMNIPMLVKHNEIYVETEKQMDWVYYVGLNMLLAWAIFTFYRTVWSADLVFDGYMLSAEYVLRCFKKWLAVAVALGMLLTWHERIGENAIITALFPFEGYTLLHVIQYYKTAVAGIYLALVTAAMAAVTVLFIVGIVKTHRKKYRVRKSLIRIREILFFALVPAVPMSRLLSSSMPLSAVPPTFPSAPQLVGAEVINMAVRFIQSI